jgi:hypothetical protein
VTVQTTAKPSREILEDRIAGLYSPDGDKMGRQVLWLSNALTWLVVRVARLDDDSAAPGTGQVADELLDLIRETIVRRVDELGLAR